MSRRKNKKRVEQTEQPRRLRHHIRQAGIACLKPYVEDCDQCGAKAGARFIGINERRYCNDCYMVFSRQYLSSWRGRAAEPSAYEYLANKLRKLRHIEKRRAYMAKPPTEPIPAPKPKLKIVKPEQERRREIFDSWKVLWLEIIRRSPEYRAWRNDVLAEQGKQCAFCDTTEGVMHVHHKKSARMNPDLIFDKDNAVVLCAKCHENLHIDRYDKRQAKQKAI